MKFVILDNTGWTMHFHALQSISRAAETASAMSRRASERLVRWTLRSSSLLLHFFVHTPLHPYTFERSCATTRHVRRYKFFSHSSEIPVRSTDAKTRCTIVHVRCHILSIAETTTPACRGRRALPNGDRCAMHANQNVSQSSPPAVAATGAGAVDAATGWRADVAIAVRFAGASRPSRAVAGAGVAADTAAGAAGIARGA